MCGTPVAGFLVLKTYQLIPIRIALHSASSKGGDEEQNIMSDASDIDQDISSKRNKKLNTTITSTKQINDIIETNSIILPSIPTPHQSIQSNPTWHTHRLPTIQYIKPQWQRSHLREKAT